MSKASIVAEVKAILRAQLDTARQAAAAAHAAATSEESKQEGKYDTRAVEAAYLAGAQARQLAEAAATLAAIEAASFPDFPADQPIGPGALVEADLAGERRFFLLTPRAGGLTLPYDGSTVELLSPEAPLRHALEGLHCGDLLAEPDLLVLEVR